MTFQKKKSWWRSTVNFIKNIKAKFSTKKDIKNDAHASDDLMTDPVTGLIRGLTLNGTVSHVKDFLSDKSEYCGQ
ncbi:hypothetical protein IE993_27350 [Klebsiella pneumoniae]|nr:hypothetical protein [Klebsiella pneumoniae]